MNHCKKCGNNIPDHVNDCDEAGFGEDCGNKIATTPTVEEIARQAANHVWNTHGRHTHTELDAVITQALTTYGNARYEEGVKAEREWCKNIVVEHLRTNTYDGNDARVFKTTIEEVVELLSNSK